MVPNKNWKSSYSCDGGSLRVYNNTIDIGFLNSVGDGKFGVEVNYKDRFSYRKGNFIGAFSVRTEAYISSSDCSDDPIHTLIPGRYAVHSHSNGNMTLVYWDNRIYKE
jgi:hypothetical protein